MEIASQLQAVRDRIQEALLRSGARQRHVRLVAVSKRHPPEAIEAAYLAGQRDFGENLAQEMTAKMRSLSHLTDIEWHFIGRVQRNKAKEIVAAGWIHGIGSVPHAEALSRRAAGPLTVLLQVNVSGEVQKNGFENEALRDSLDAISRLPNLNVQGLMCLPAPGQGRAGFECLREIRDRLATTTLPLPELSMGMSSDFESAVEEGATIVRVGSAIFGPRPAPNGA